MKVVGTIFFFLCATGIHADPGSITWYSGSVVLSNQEVYVGELYIENQFDLLLIKEDSKVKVLPAHKIQAIYYYDSAENINRRFVSIAEQQESFRYFRLYEIVLRGEVSVLRREKRYADHQLEDYHSAGFQYYVQWNNNLTNLKKFRVDVFPQLPEFSNPALNSYIRKNKLNCNQEGDAIRIIDFYNHLANDQVIAAR